MLAVRPILDRLVVVTLTGMTTTAVRPRRVPPRSVRLAAASVLTGVGVHALGLGVFLLWRWAWQEQHPSTPVPHGTPVLVLVAWTVLVCALGVFFACRMLGGADWARVTLMVFAVGELLLSVLGVVRSVVVAGLHPAAGVFWVVVSALVALCALAFLLTACHRSTDAFFAGRTPVA